MESVFNFPRLFEDQGNQPGAVWRPKTFKGNLRTDKYFKRYAMKNWLKLLISILLPQVAAGIGAYFTVTGTGTWYQTIEKPDWNPPSWLFAPVWTILYIAMGVAFYLIWKSSAAPGKKRTAMILWGVQLVLNLFWTIIFFNQHQLFWATVEIAVLWVAILATIFAFAKISKVAAWLLVPYIAWVSFAGILTWTIWSLN